MHSSSSLEHPSSLEPLVSSFSLSLYLFYFFLVYCNHSPRNLTIENGLFSSPSSEASLATFRAAYSIPKDVDIAYCHEDDIDIQRHHGANTVFFPLMAILEGRIRFFVDPLVIGTLRFYDLCLDQLPLTFTEW